MTKKPKQIMRMAKLKNFGEIAKSAMHTFREIETLNANPSKASKNAHTVANAAAVVDGIKNRLDSLKVRKNAVLALEFLVTASPQFFKKRSGGSYFTDAKLWLDQKYGAENVISGHVHRDETTPHAVFYVVPVDKKGNLNARDSVGGIYKLSKMQDDFYNTVAKKYKLERGLKGSKATHTTLKKFYDLANSEAPPPPTRLNLLLMNDEQRLETMQKLHAQAIYSNAHVAILEDEREKFTAKISGMKKLLDEKTYDENLIRKAIAKSLKNTFSPAQFAQTFKIELRGKGGDIFDALIATGQAANFATAVAMVALKMPSPYAASWRELAEWTADYDRKPTIASAVIPVPDNVPAPVPRRPRFKP